MAEQLKDSSDHQAASTTPLVVTKIDDEMHNKPAIIDKTRFAFVTPATPEAVPLPHTSMDEDTMGGTQPAHASPAKRPRLADITDVDAERHQLARTTNDDGLEKRLQGIDVRISTEVGLLKGDIQSMSSKIYGLADSIRALPRTHMPKWVCKNGRKQDPFLDHPIEEGGYFWVVVREGMFDKWEAYKIEVTGVARDKG